MIRQAFRDGARDLLRSAHSLGRENDEYAVDVGVVEYGIQRGAVSIILSIADEIDRIVHGGRRRQGTLERRDGPAAEAGHAKAGMLNRI
jgi:hypothetical protein